MLNRFLNTIKNNSEVKVINKAIENVCVKIVFVTELANIKKFIQQIEKFITINNYKHLDKDFPGSIISIDDLSLYNLEYLLYSGNIIIIFDNDIAYYGSFQEKPKRSINPSKIDPPDVTESQDGLIEDLNTNINLIKKRIKSSKLIIDKYKIGMLSKTDLGIIYLKDNYNKFDLKNVIDTINKIDSSVVTTITDISYLFNDGFLVPQVFSTSSPEIICEALCKNRIVILLDNSPIALIVPSTFSTFTISKSYTNTPKYYNLFNHLFIAFFFFIAMFLMGFLISIINFHQGFFSMKLLSNIKITEKGTNWSMFLEVLIVYALFEFYRLATSRSSDNYIQNIIVILGGLFIGQNAIDSGMIGATILFFSSITYLSVFVITSNVYLITSLNIFRLIILISSYTLGIIGFICSCLITIFYLYKQKTNSSYYLFPIMPFNFKKFKEFFIPRKQVNKS